MIDRRLFKLPGIRKTLMMLAALTVLQAFSVLFQGKFLSESIVVLWKQNPINQAIVFIVGFIVAFALRHVLTVLKNYAMGKWVEQTTQAMRHDLLVKVSELGPQVIQKKGTGNAVTLTLEGMDKVQTYLMLVMIKMFDMSIIPWILLVYMFTISWPEALFLLAIYPVVILFMIILGLAAQAKADKEYANFTRLSNHFVDALRGLPTLKQLGLSKKYADNIHEVSEDYRKSVLSTLKIAILSTFTLDFFTTLSIAVVAVFLGFSLLDGHMTLLPALTMLVLAPEYFLPLRNFANDYHATLDGKNAMSDVLEVLETPTPVADAAFQLTQWTPTDTLQMDNVQLTYPDGQTPALSEISFSAHGYQRIGLVGKSGSGKSTLLDLIGGFLQPDDDSVGSIQVNGHQLEHLQQATWQRQFQYIPQAPYLFHATLAENIKFYQPNATATAITAAVEQAGLTELVAALPAGLDTLIGEGGQAVSGGQAQRIALARAFLSPDRHVLLFDEPTAHLDIETEINLKKAMLPLLDNHLVFFATHRLHWLNEMDYVLVMEDGKIVEQGTPAELLAQNGTYVALRHEMGKLGGLD